MASRAPATCALFLLRPAFARTLPLTFHAKHPFSTSSAVTRKVAGYSNIKAAQKQQNKPLFIFGEALEALGNLGFKNPKSALDNENSRQAVALQLMISPRISAKRYASEEDFRQSYEQDEKRSPDPIIMGRVCYWYGWCLLHPLNRATDFTSKAEYSLSIGAELGDVKAGILLWQLEKMKNRGVPSAAAMSVVKNAALNQSDWRAMSLYIRHQLSSSRFDPFMRKETYELAKDLFAMVEPGKEAATGGQLYDVSEQPWKLLENAADQHLYDCINEPNAAEIQEWQELAIREGALRYTDPEACRMMSDLPSVGKYSRTWVELKTQSAMQGDHDDSFLLARYYLEKHGVYPCTGKLPKHMMGMLGFDWLELSAKQAIDNPAAMAERFLIGALILRENGDIGAGLTWLKVGIEDLELTLDENAAGKSIQKLQTFQRNWSEGFTDSASGVLGPPLLKQVA